MKLRGYLLAFVIIAALLSLGSVLGGWIFGKVGSQKHHQVGTSDKISGTPSAWPVPSDEAMKCAGCHRDAFEAWAGSHHAVANRLFDPQNEYGAFIPSRRFVRGDFTTEAFSEAGKLMIRTSGPDGVATFVPEAVIGVSPLKQYLVRFPGGRLQALDAAFDPARQEWFDTNGGENRQPHEWGFWKNRGMNWNAQCAFCHMTGLVKGYDIDADAFKTTWKAMGVSCSQCHGDMSAHLEHSTEAIGTAALSRQQTIENCGSCHGRREELTGKFKPGDSFYDHFRPVLVDRTGIYYPDGQIHEESFEYGSFLMSRMAHKGVSCLDCHNPHTGKTVLPVENNVLCLSCHAPPTRMGATPIVSAVHTFHKSGTPGDRCVDCHMPVTTYMQRHPRRDHGFTIPDPVLTKEQGTPNACNRCHFDKSTAWAIEWTQKWNGAKMERRTRERARVVGRALRQDNSVLSELISLTRSEEIAPWRSVLVGLLGPWAARPEVHSLLKESLHDDYPLVRSAALQPLGNDPEDAALARALLDDPYRLVRLDATVVELRTSTKVPLPRYNEYRQYLDNMSDQPVGAMRQAGLAIEEGRLPDAEAWARKGAAWDSSAASQSMLGTVLHAAGKLDAAEHAFQAAIDREPGNASLHYTLALLYGEMNRAIDVVAVLKKTVEIDPQFGRAWYNLGLAEAQLDDLSDAVTSLRRSEALMPQSPEPAYARATIHLRQHDAAAAREAIRQSLLADPDYAPAKQLGAQLQ